MNKTCTTCLIDCSLEDFPKNPNGKFGRYSKCLKCLSKKGKEWYANGGKEYKKKYQKINRTAINNKINYYIKNRRKYDLNFRIRLALRARVSQAFIKGQKCKKTSELLGCSLVELKIHLESNFQPGMTWENYGLKGWHIDHIIPLSSAKSIEELEKLCHYTNLQPLWAKDNLSKGSKIYA